MKKKQLLLGGTAAGLARPGLSRPDLSRPTAAPPSSPSSSRKFSLLSRVFFLMCLFCTLVSTGSNAQGIVQGAGQIGNTIIQIINIAFPVACGLALLAVIWNVFTRNPQWKDYTIGLFIGLLLWGAYTTYKDEIFGYFGGSDVFEVTVN